MKIDQRKPAIPEAFRIFVAILSTLFGLAAALLAVAVQFFDIPQLQSSRDTLLVLFSIVTVTSVLPVAVFMSLTRAASVSHEFEDPLKFKQETRLSLFASLGIAIAGILAGLGWLLGSGEPLPFSALTLSGAIVVILPSVAWLAIYIIYERTFETNKSHTSHSKRSARVGSENAKMKTPRPRRRVSS